jgi:uncharacterized protein (TIRG00374 family)
MQRFDARDVAAGPTRPEPPDRRRGRIRRWLPAVLWVVGIGVAIAAIRTALPELRDGIAAVRQADLRVLVLAVAIQAIALATYPLTFRAALQMLGEHVSYGVALNAALGAVALSRIMPGGGLAGSLYAVRRFFVSGATTAVAAAGVAVASTINMLALAVVVTGGALLEAATGGGSAKLAWFVAAFLAVLVIVFTVLVRVLRSPRQLDRLAQNAGRLLKRPEEVEAVRRHLTQVAPNLAHPRGLSMVTGWSTFTWTAQLLALWVIFIAFGVTMPVGVLILGFGAAHLFTMMPHTPGGLGVVEAGMTATYVALGVPVATALVGVLSYRLLGHWLPVIVALPMVLPHLGRSRRPRDKVADRP